MHLRVMSRKELIRKPIFQIVCRTGKAREGKRERQTDRH
jgi:hypothetical protein